MTEYGHMAVDWEERINFDRLRRDRLANVKAAMEKLGVNALLVFRPENARYITGFRTLWLPVCHVGPPRTILTSDGAPILYGDVYATLTKERLPWIAPENIRPWGNPEEWKQALGKHIVGRIGVDIWTPAMFELLPKALPEAKFVDGQKVMEEAQLIKTRDEMECLKAATVITEAGMDAALRFLRPGVKECEVLAAAWGEMTRLGSEYFQCSNIVASGPNTAPYRKVTSDRILRRGDVVILDIGGCFNGYWGDVTRTWICGNGSPTKEQRRLHQACYNSLFAACEASKPGNTTADVYHAGEPNVLDGRSGHGSSLSPFEPPFFSASSKNDPMTLRIGMAFNLEFYTGKPGVGGFRLENQLWMTATGPEIYSTYPFDDRLLDEIHPLDVGTRHKV